MHLRRRALEKAAATRHEQRIPDERHAMTMKGDMTGCMARHIEYLEADAESSQFDHVAFLHGARLSGDRLARRADDGNGVLFEYALDTADMVPVMVGSKDRFRDEALGADDLEDRRGVARIDESDAPIVGIDDQPDVVIREGRDWFYLEHGIMLPGGDRRVNLPRRLPLQDGSATAAMTGPKKPTTVSDGLRRWFEQVPGRYLIGMEQACLGRVLPGLFGYHIVQVGHCTSPDLLDASRISHKMTLYLSAGADRNSGVTLVCSAESLPFAPDSVDVVVLPHVLEFASNPHRVLREVERVLIGEGHLVLFGFNPWSLWGFWRLVLAWSEEPPWCGHYYGLARLRDWLSLLDFEVLSVERFLFRPPLHNAAVMERFQALEKLGRHIWPIFGAAYMVVAKKCVTPLTPVRNRWRARRRMIAEGIAEPSIRESTTE